MKNKRTGKPLVWAAAAVLLAGLCGWLWWGNVTPTLTAYEIASPHLPAAFEGYRIVQLSDLHNAELGQDNQRVTALLEQADPDLIVVTGDAIDSRRTDTRHALSLLEQAARMAPCYFVAGNHEARREDYPDFCRQLSVIGVTVLDGAKVTLTRDGDTVTLMGVADPTCSPDRYTVEEPDILRGWLDSLTEEEGFTILLSHRPEYLEVYADNGAELVFSGHAHGGQIRLPWLGGVFAPNQGLFPAYDGGVYTAGDTRMVVSRGIGNSILPLRVNNRPEVVLVTLVSESSTATDRPSAEGRFLGDLRLYRYKALNFCMIAQEL